jgi:hypothetical protein
VEATVSVQRLRSLTPRDLFGLTRTRAVVLLGLFAVTEAALALTGGGPFDVTWQSVVSLVLIIGCAVMSLLPGPFPLGSRQTIIILAVIVVTTIIMSWSLPTNGAAFTYSSWQLGANTFLLFALALRGRIVLAWFGMALMSAITVLWTTTTDQGVESGIDLVDRQWGTLVLGTLFAIALVRSARSIQAATDVENKRIIDAEVERAGAEERARHLLQLETTAGPALRAIASGDPLDERSRREFLVLEAALRDQLRAVALSREPLLTSSRRARLRGVDVILLDDSEETVSDERLATDVAIWMADQLDSVSLGTFTARLRSDPEGFTATVVSGDLRLSRRFTRTIGLSHAAPST